MFRARTRNKVLVSEEQEIHAWLWGGKYREGYDTLEVYASPVVQETDECYGPIHDVLGESCSRCTDVQEVRDPKMMFARAVQTIHQVFHKCPGESCPHNCRASRQEVHKSSLATPRKSMVAAVLTAALSVPAGAVVGVAALAPIGTPSGGGSGVSAGGSEADSDSDAEDVLSVPELPTDEPEATRKADPQKDPSTRVVVVEAPAETASSMSTATPEPKPVAETATDTVDQVTGTVGQVTEPVQEIVEPVTQPVERAIPEVPDIPTIQVPDRVQDKIGSFFSENIPDDLDGLLSTDDSDEEESNNDDSTSEGGTPA